MYPTGLLGRFRSVETDPSGHEPLLTLREKKDTNTFTYERSTMNGRAWCVS